ncbi:Spo0B domain-containing protein [Lysinibacillus sp. MHQ-1]|nr:Spo0B domain-containing protein [Lysinibacillus sp. MHQ-1]
MNNQSLTISEVLRFANHDFVNQLQLIRMNLDLGRVDESKELIQHFFRTVKSVFYPQSTTITTNN